MKAAFINEHGGPEKIIYGDLPEPKAGPSQYLVKVKAVDVNPVDLYIRSGAVPTKMNFPYILGRDLAGEIARQGRTQSVSRSATVFGASARAGTVGPGRFPNSPLWMKAG
ncbi:MAG TPA: alcohol dehydrogenase catalytic domain-containing protein [Verrucomicrobiae bacterium]